MITTINDLSSDDQYQITRLHLINPTLFDQEQLNCVTYSYYKKLIQLASCYHERTKKRVAFDPEHFYRWTEENYTPFEHFSKLIECHKFQVEVSDLINSTNDFLTKRFNLRESKIVGNEYEHDIDNCIKDKLPSIKAIIDDHLTYSPSHELLQTKKTDLEKALDKRYEQAKDRELVYMGFDVLDRYSNHLSCGEVAVFVARAGKGKSLLGQNIAINHCLHPTSRGALLVSLEMTKDNYLDRHISILTGIPLNTIKRVFTKSGRDDVLFNSIKSQLSSIPEFSSPLRYLYLKDNTIDNVVEVLEKNIQLFKPSLVVFDYLNALEQSNERLKKLGQGAQYKVASDMILWLQDKGLKYNFGTIAFAHNNSSGSKASKTVVNENTKDARRRYGPSQEDVAGGLDTSRKAQRMYQVEFISKDHNSKHNSLIITGTKSRDGFNIPIGCGTQEEFSIWYEVSKSCAKVSEVKEFNKVPYRFEDDPQELKEEAILAEELRKQEEKNKKMQAAKEEQDKKIKQMAQQSGF